jgi:beta-lactamase class A
VKKYACVATLILLNAIFSLLVTGQGKPQQGRELLWKKLESSIGRIDAGFDGVLGVAIQDLTDGRELRYNADQVFPTASTIKIAVLAELYHQAGQNRNGAGGRDVLDKIYAVQAKDLVGGSGVMNGFTAGTTQLTNKDLSYLMIVLSDNSATNVLIDQVGMDNVNNLLGTLGLRDTRLRRKQMDVKAAAEGRENTATPAELVALLRAIYSGKLIGDEMTRPLLELLKTPKDSYIPRLLPENVSVANKPGVLDGVRVDAGIVFAHNRPFAIAVMTAYDRDGAEAEQVIGRIALESYRYFERVGRASEFGRFLAR